MRSAALLALLLLCACSQEQSASTPQPVTLTEEALGHFCQMNMLEQPGPRAQVHISGDTHPIWFMQIRDAFAFDRMPEEPAKVLAIYVNDMGAPGASWESPGVDNWIAAADAFYVTGSSRRGGMGAPDFIPFSERAAAERFAGEYGGKVIAYADIDDDAVLTPVEVDVTPPTETTTPDDEGKGGEG